MLCEEGIAFEAFESQPTSIGHAVIAGAMSMAIERLDAELCSGLPEGCRVHDKGRKAFASAVGDLKSEYRRVREPPRRESESGRLNCFLVGKFFTLKPGMRLRQAVDVVGAYRRRAYPCKEAITVLA